MRNSERRLSKRAWFWSAVAAICAVFAVGYFAGLQAAIGMVAIVAVLAVGFALQDALGWLAVKALEGALHLFAARR